MYCNTYVNSYDAIGSVIPCEKWPKHQCFHSSATAACSTWRVSEWGPPFLSWNRNFPNKEVRQSHSLVRSWLKRSNFWVKLKDCFAYARRQLHSLVRSWLKRSNFWVKLKDCFAYARRHGTWNSLGRTNTWAIFPRSVVQLLGGIWLAYSYYGATTHSKQFR